MRQTCLSNLLPLCACLIMAACAATPPARPGDLSADARLRVAEAAESAGDDDLAASMYVAVAAKAPSDTALQLRAADVLMRQGKVGEATTLIAERLKATPNEPELLRTLAVIETMSGRPDLANGKLDQVLATRPEDNPALTDKAVALDMEGRHAEAQTIYRRVLAAAPDDAVTASDLALSLVLSAKLSEARAVLAPFENRTDLPARARNTLGVLAAAEGDAEQSRELLQNRVPDTLVAQVVARLQSFGTEKP